MTKPTPLPARVDPSDAMIERVKAAIDDANVGYSVNLVRLVDGEATYEANCAGQVREFPDHSSAADWVHGFRLEAQARAAIAAMKEVP